MSESEAPRSTYRTMYVSAQMGEIHQKKKVRTQVGMHKRTRTEGLFSKKEVEVEEPIYEDVDEWVPTGQISDTFIEPFDFASSIEDACNRLADAGYEVHSILPVIRGDYNWASRGVETQPFQTPANVAGGYGYGYSYTDGAVITGRLRE